MKNKKLKRISIVNLIAGYVCALLLVLLIILNRSEEPPIEQAKDVVDLNKSELFNGSHEKEVVYLDRRENIFINDKKIYGNPIDIWQSYIDSWKKTKNNGYKM